VVFLFFIFININVRRRVWRYQKGNQNLCVEQGQTTQWSKGEGL